MDQGSMGSGEKWLVSELQIYYEDRTDKFNEKSDVGMGDKRGACNDYDF